MTTTTIPPRYVYKLLEHPLNPGDYEWINYFDYRESPGEFLVYEQDISTNRVLVRRIHRKKLDTFTQDGEE